jgi:hypothetical protein
MEITIDETEVENTRTILAIAQYNLRDTLDKLELTLSDLQDMGASNFLSGSEAKLIEAKNLIDGVLVDIEAEAYRLK